MTDLNFIHLEAKDIKKAIEALKKNGVGQNGCQVVLDANKVYQIMLENERLRRKPDPDTGLMKCGCGGVPEYQIQTARFQHEVSVGCPKCFASSAHAIAQHDQPVEGLKMIARENWNTAMGWREKE